MGVPSDLAELARTGRGVRCRESPGPHVTSSCRRPPGTATCRSRSTSEPGSARRSSTGWSTRCSAASTQDARRNCPSTRPCRRWRLPRGGTGHSRRRSARCSRRRRRLRPGTRTRCPSARGPAARCSPPSPGDWACCPPTWPRPPGAEVRTGSMARGCPRRRLLLRRRPGWRLTVGSAAAEEQIDADAVDPRPARAAWPDACSRRCRGASAAVTALAEISYASMAIVTLAYPRAAFPGAGLTALGLSGYLVPAVDGRAVKAVTFSTVKWPHLALATAGGAEPLEFVRCSVGRDRRGSPAATGRRGSRRAWPRPSSRRRPGCAARRSRTGSPAGAAGCRSTRSGTWTGWRRSGRARDPAGPGRLWRGLRRHRHTGLHRDGPRGGRPGAGRSHRQPWPTIVTWLTNKG